MMLELCSLLFSIFLLVHLVIPSKAAYIPINERERLTTCGYQSCPKVDPQKLNIHLVAHTHDDVGWLKTVDQYYYGGRPNIQLASVEYILNSVIEALEEKPERRFIYVETAFFWKWWQQQNEKMKQVVKNLVNEGRLEFIGGAWSMNDEAVTHYQSIIDQFTLGLRWLNDTFGECGRPKIGWQIDPFGHSREQAAIFSEMGFDALLFGRLDYKDKIERLNSKTAEFIWQSNPSLGNKANLFTSVLFNDYKAPPGFCFDILCKDEPLIDDPDSPDYNIDTRMKIFLAICQIQANFYKSNNIILTMGEDFHYQQAHAWFVNLDKIIKYVNNQNGTDFNIFYSTPSCYIKAVNDFSKTWPLEHEDFFPYGSDPLSYWTGYFSSRPSLKFFERLGNNFLQVVKHLSVLNNIPSNNELDKLRIAMGILQHHDAITGTEKQHVANDYARLLHQSIEGEEKMSSIIMREWLKKKENFSEMSAHFHSCLLLNISSCPYTEQSKIFVVTLYNPTSQPLTTYVRLPVTNASFTVNDYLGNKIVNQVVPVPLEVTDIPGRVSEANYELIFSAVGIPPLGFQSFYVSETESGPNSNTLEHESFEFMGGDMFNISIVNNGQVYVQSKLKNNLSITQSFSYYEGSQNEGFNFSKRNSGAYVFRPKENTTAKTFDYIGSYKIFKGPLVEELHVKINDWISQVVRVYNGEDRVEFNWLIGPIDVSDEIGREIVTRYTSNLKSKGLFYTDSNGRQMMRRKRNFRPTWNQTFKEAVSSNYYPITTKICLKETQSGSKVSVYTDRSEGGTSLRDGELELMLHRRLLVDDGFGVGEALNEEAFGKGLVVRGQHVVLFGENSEKSALEEKTLALQLSLKPWTFITPLEGISFQQWRDNFNMQGTSLNKALPPNIHILTLEPWKDGSILLRLEHIFEAGYSSKYSLPVAINIQDLFSAFRIISIEETNLSANQWLRDLNPLKWQSETEENFTRSEDLLNKREVDSQVKNDEVQEDESIREDNFSFGKISVQQLLHFRKKRKEELYSNQYTIHLNPMEIKTFVLKFMPRFKK